MILNLIITAFLFIVSIVGNSLQFIVFSRKKFSKFSARNSYRVLAL